MSLETFVVANSFNQNMLSTSSREYDKLLGWNRTKAM